MTSSHLSFSTLWASLRDISSGHAPGWQVGEDFWVVGLEFVEPNVAEALLRVAAARPVPYQLVREHPADVVEDVTVIAVLQHAAVLGVQDALEVDLHCLPVPW